MIQSIGMVMLYVEDTKAAMTFWTEKVGFSLLETSEYPGATSYVIAPSEKAEAQYGIHDKNWVATNNPGMNVGFPSLLLATDDLKKTYDELTARGVTTHPITEHQGLIHFSFADNEGNYVAVQEVK